MVLVYDSRIPGEYEEALKEKLAGHELIPLEMTSLSSAYSSILNHPDIYFFQFSSNEFIHSPIVPEIILKKIIRDNTIASKGQRAPGSEYPDTVLYNAVCVGNALFHNLKYTDPVILNRAKEKKMKLVNVPQGYARCSTLVVNERAIVTSDALVASAAEREGIDSLLVETKEVLLPGEKYGFLGGTSGKINNETIVFLGDLTLHSEGTKIKEFILKHGSTIIELNDLKLYDGGGLLFF